MHTATSAEVKLDCHHDSAALRPRPASPVVDTTFPPPRLCRSPAPHTAVVVCPERPHDRLAYGLLDARVARGTWVQQAGGEAGAGAVSSGQ